jgi:hypothetical protein
MEKEEVAQIAITAQSEDVEHQEDIGKRRITRRVVSRRRIPPIVVQLDPPWTRFLCSPFYIPSFAA